MHEAAIASGILDAVRRSLADRGPVRLRLVRVRIGRFAGVEPDCLEFAWNVMREETLAAGVPLEIETVVATARCRTCGREYDVMDVSLQCPGCDGLDVVLLTGRELMVSEIEIEESEPAVESGGAP